MDRYEKYRGYSRGHISNLEFGYSKSRPKMKASRSRNIGGARRYGESRENNKYKGSKLNNIQVEASHSNLDQSELSSASGNQKNSINQIRNLDPKSNSKVFSSGRSEVKNSNYRISSGNKAPIYPGVSQVSGDRTSNPSVSTYTNSLYINETAQPTHTDTYSKSAISNLYKYSEPKIDKFSADARGIVGLDNIGNTCYMNSTLQCLLNTPGFSDFFFEATSNQLYGKLGIAASFGELVKKVKSKTKGSSTQPRDLKNSVSKKSRRFSGYQQQDAQEFLVFLLEGISEDLNILKTKPKYKELDYHKSKSMQENSDEWFNYYLNRESSIVTDYFLGQFISSIICKKCSNRSISFDNFMDLSLSFKKSRSSYGYGYSSKDLMDLMILFFNPEDLDDKFPCSKCKKPRASQKEMKIYKLPKILPIQLKRFNFGGGYGGRKIMTTVNIPEVLDLSKLVVDSEDKSTQYPRYNLFGIVDHMGSLNGGHYTAKCKNSDNRRWYEFNDSSVHEISVHFPLSSSSAYILFYARD